MDIRYPAILKPEKTGYFVQFVDFDETSTKGKTLDEALLNAAEMLTLTLNARMEENQPIPEPSVGVRRARLIAPHAKTQAALLVRRARGDITLTELARILESSWAAVQRLEDPHHFSTLKQLERAASALGKRLVLVFE